MGHPATKRLTKNSETAFSASDIEDGALPLPAFAAEVFLRPRRPMAHPGRPRKAGARHPNGRLRWVPSHDDKGHPLVLLHRMIAGGDPTDSRAGFPLGILAMQGHLADPGLEGQEAEEQTYQRLQAGLRFAAYRAGAWVGSGRPPPHPRCHLASFALATSGDETFINLDEFDPVARQRHCEREEQKARAHILVYGLYPMFVLEDIASDEHRMRFMDAEDPQLTAADHFTLSALRQALGALVRDYKPQPRDRQAGMHLGRQGHGIVPR